MLDRLLPGPEPKRFRLEAEGGNGGRREQGEAIPAAFDRPRPLQEAMDEDDIRSGQLVAAGDATVDEGTVVDEQLEVEFWSQPAGVAVATCGLVDTAQAPPEGVVGRLDGVEE